MKQGLCFPTHYGGSTPCPASYVAQARTPWTKGPLIGPTPPLKLREIWAIEQRPRKKSFKLPAGDEFQSAAHRVMRPHPQSNTYAMVDGLTQGQVQLTDSIAVPAAPITRFRRASCIHLRKELLRIDAAPPVGVRRMPSAGEA